MSFHEKRLCITNSTYFGVCFLPGLAGTKSPISDLQPCWIPCTSACFSDQRRQKHTQITLSTVFLRKNEIELKEPGIFHCKRSIFYFTTHPCLGLLLSPSAGRTLQARSPVCHPSGSRPRPARALRAGASCRGLARIWDLGGSHGSPQSGSGVN